VAKEHYRLAEERELTSIVDMLGDPEVGRWLWFTPGTPEFLQQYFRPIIDAQTGERRVRRRERREAVARQRLNSAALDAQLVQALQAGLTHFAG
jgi:hypothetical protein